MSLLDGQADTMEDQLGRPFVKVPRRRNGGLGSLRTDYTARNRAELERGIHPATRRAVCPELGTCGTCAHAVRWSRGPGKAWIKCDRHRLGMSHSEASDIRASWPACELYTPTQEGPTP